MMTLVFRGDVLFVIRHVSIRVFCGSEVVSIEHYSNSGSALILPQVGAKIIFPNTNEETSGLVREYARRRARNEKT
jgi:pyruvate/2-oxoglutarate/acetoin dehydrogenase E1 component